MTADAYPGGQVKVARPPEVRVWAMMTHLAALLPLPLGRIVGPLIVWLIKRRDPWVAVEVRKVLNFQLSFIVWFVGNAVVGIILGALGSFRGPDFGHAILLVFLGLGVVLWLAAIVLVVRAAIAVCNDRPSHYPLSIPFLGSESRGQP